MNTSRHSSTSVFSLADGLGISGDVTLGTVASLEAECLGLIDLSTLRALQCDLSSVTRLDTAGALFLRRLQKLSAGRDKELTLSRLPAEQQSFFDFVQPPSQPQAEAITDADSSMSLEYLGGRIDEALSQAATFLFLVSDLTWSAVAALPKRAGMRRGAFIEQAILVGSQGVPIITLILFLIGAVSTLQAVAQLRQFGANIFAADLLAVGICRELGPLMTAIVVAGRSGSAIAAEIATMKFTEELDALKTMALDPLRLVAVPKLWAMVLTVPLLTIMADLAGLIGGTVTGVFSLDLAPQTFVTRVTEALLLKDILTGLLKSVTFGWIITMIAVYRGLEFKGGATGVGQATTSAVVSSIFGIIVLDLTWGLIFYLR